MANLVVKIDDYEAFNGPIREGWAFSVVQDGKGGVKVELGEPRPSLGEMFGKAATGGKPSRADRIREKDSE